MVTISRKNNSEVRAYKRLTVALTILTVMWVSLLIVSEAIGDPAVTVMDYALRFHTRPALYRMIYLNAGVLTLVTATWMIAWILQRDKVYSTVCVVGFVTTVIYGVLNSAVYFSQVLVVPGLVKQVYTSAQQSAEFVNRLGIWMQAYPESTIALLNQLAYAMLAVPSVIVGRRMLEQDGAIRGAGWCLIISGVLSVVAVAGVLIGVPALGVLSLVSGVVFLVGLVLRWVGYP